MFKERSRIDSCCYGCTEKFEACHDVCATYLQARAKFDEEKARIREAREKALFFDNYRRDYSMKQRKIKQNHKMK